MSLVYVKLYIKKNCGRWLDVSIDVGAVGLDSAAGMAITLMGWSNGYGTM